MRTHLCGILALCLLASSVQAVITHAGNEVPVGSYTVSVGATSTVVDVYRISFDAGPDRVLGALVLDIGLSAGLGGSDPFQAGWKYSGKGGTLVALTPTDDDARIWLWPPDATKCYESDTHFLPAGIGTWMPAILNPAEANSGAIFSELNNYHVGQGSLTVITAVPVAYRVQAMDVMQVGVIRGGVVWCKSGSADDMGIVTDDCFMIPEPATLSVLAAGTLVLRRRRAGATRRRGPGCAGQSSPPPTPSERPGGGKVHP